MFAFNRVQSGNSCFVWIAIVYWQIYLSLDLLILSSLTKNREKIIVIAAAIMLFSFVFLFFNDVRHADFLHWDDDAYILKNDLVKSLDFVSIRNLFTTFYFANWHPVTWLSHAIDIRLFGYNPSAHHIVNLIFHSFNAVLLFVLTLIVIKIYTQSEEIGKKDGRLYWQAILLAFITSFWFAIHPLRIESFAWVSERKDVLCAFFALLATIFYLYRFIHPEKSKLFYILCFMAFVMAVMSKAMAVTLPIVLFLLDMFPAFRLHSSFSSWRNLLADKEFKNAIFEKIPFILVSIVASIIVFFAQLDAGAVKSIETVDYDVRFLNATNTIFVYLAKTILPTHLLPIYPYPEHVFSLNLLSVSQLIALVMCLCFLIYKAIKGSPVYLLVSLTYLILLSPVLGLVQIGEQAYADRYSYIPTLPLFITLAVVLLKCVEKPDLPLLRYRMVRVIPFVLVSILIAVSLNRADDYLEVWRDDRSIWSYVINYSAKPAVVAYNNLGARYKDEQQYKEAEKILKMGIDRYPENKSLYGNMRSLYQLTGNYKAAIEFIDELRRINGDSEVYLVDRIHFQIEQGVFDSALELALEGVERYQHSIQLKYQAAFCYAAMGKYNLADHYLDDILESNHEYPQAILLKKEIAALSGN